MPEPTPNQRFPLEVRGTVKLEDRDDAAEAPDGVLTVEPPSALGQAAEVWWMDLGGLPAATVEAWSDLLDAEERARAARFLQIADRLAFIAAHGLLRTMLTRHAGMPARDWRFVAGPRGKPALNPDHRLAALEFNLSHTRGAVACGVAWGCPIGVDIEDQDRAYDPLDLAEAYFAAAEIALLQAASPVDRRALFFQLWTLKEAYIKACGGGLFMPLDAFAFSVDPVRISFPGQGAGDAADWRFLTLDCTPRHRLSAAVRSAAMRTIMVRQVTAADIAPRPPLVGPA